MKKFVYFFILFIVSGLVLATPTNTLTLGGNISDVVYPGPVNNDVTPEPNVNMMMSPDENYPSSINSSGNTVSFKADRSATQIPVQWVESQMNTNESGSWLSNNVITAKGGNSLPANLNFALKGTLNFTYNGNRYQCMNIMFGQQQYPQNHTDYPWFMFSNINNADAGIVDYTQDNKIIIECETTNDPTTPVYFYFAPAENDSTFNLVGTVNLDAPPTGITVNRLCFVAAKKPKIDTFQIIGFESSEIDVTPGQAYNSQISVNNNCLEVNSNRENSDQVVQAVQSVFQSEGIQWSSSNMGTRGFDDSGLPQQLEFAIKGTLIINYAGIDYSCKNTMFGQGYDQFNKNHNWWAFSNVNTPDAKDNIVALNCKIDQSNSDGIMNQNYVFFLKAGSNYDQFTVLNGTSTCQANAKDCSKEFKSIISALGNAGD